MVKHAGISIGGGRVCLEIPITDDIPSINPPLQIRFNSKFTSNSKSHTSQVHRRGGFMLANSVLQYSIPNEPAQPHQQQSIIQ